jgi:hypothetical protein
MYAGLSAELKPGDPVLLNDGTVRMIVMESAGVPGSTVTCRVDEPGMVSSRKGINVPGTLVELPSIGPKVGVFALMHLLFTLAHLRTGCHKRSVRPFSSHGTHIDGRMPQALVHTAAARASVLRLHHNSMRWRCTDTVHWHHHRTRVFVEQLLAFFCASYYYGFSLFIVI